VLIIVIDYDYRRLDTEIQEEDKTRTSVVVVFQPTMRVTFCGTSGYFGYVGLG
jgi:hypothetical protein